MALSSRAEASKLRTRLENARLSLLALFRALDQMLLDPNQIPQDLLHQLFELDADFAEGLWALDQPPQRLDFTAVLRDTTAALSNFPKLSERFRASLPPHLASALATREESLLSRIRPDEAYNQVPGRDPKIC